MSFSLPYWFLIPVLAIGAWLAYRLYFGSTAMPKRWRWMLGTLTLIAWLVLAGLLIQPLWTRVAAVYHPPTIALAVDESPSYSAGSTLHSAETLRKSVEAVRKYYGEKGFQILEFGFAEKVFPRDSNANISAQKLGTLTSLESLRSHLDSMAIPNLQGVFVWTDGRVNKDVESQGQSWPAPVFPISLPGGDFGEVQGENVEADFSNPDSGVEVDVEWRALGNGGHGASLELRSGLQSLWTESLPNPGHFSGTKLRHRLRISANVLRGKEDRLTALIRPDRKTENETEKNDTVKVGTLGLHRQRQIFPRPLRSLEERGLVDALFASDSIEVRVVSPESLAANLREGGVLWAHARTPQVVSAAKKSQAPLVVYSLPGDPVSNGTLSFTPAARVTWREDASRFFPGEVLSLADLGVSGMELHAVGGSSESIAWVEEGSRRGALLSRGKGESGMQFDFVAPPIWSSGFRPGAEDRIRGLQQRWVQGVAEYVRFQNRGAQITVSGVTIDPKILEMSRLGVDEERLSALAVITHGAVLQASNEAATFAPALPDLPRGQSEETTSKAHPLFPFMPASWIVAGLLCAAWALRKKLHLD